MQGTPSVGGVQGPSDLAGLKRILSRIEIGPLLALFQRKPGRGRPPYDRMPTILAYLASYYLNIRTIQVIVDRLNNNPALRQVCGFRYWIPHRSTFSRTITTLARNPALVYRLFEELTHQIIYIYPYMGTLLAVDATTVDAWANPNKERTRDPEAGWTKSNSASAIGSDGKEWVYGYKVHLAACAQQALPIGFIVKPANTHDGRTLPELLSLMKRSFPDMTPQALIADRAYDSRAIVEGLHQQGIAPIIPMRNHHSRSKGKPLYTIHGQPM